MNLRKACKEIDAMQQQFDRRVNRLDIDEIDRYDLAELDDMGGEPLPWSKAVGVACLIVAGLITAYIIVNS